MTPDERTWDRLQELFHLMEGVPECDREQKLDRAGADPELKARVLALLVAESTANTPGKYARPMAALSHDIGGYTVIERIGAGGIGTVYLVERDAGEVRQRAALKVLSPHAAGDSFIDRFRREQRILALLDHPNIARMLDAGFGGEGQPFLVMEYVEGLHLDDYCDRHNLGIAARLRLFLKIAGAVSYAHRLLVVHLDLKPSNILVTPSGSPKLLDFGTSKILQSDGRMTTTLPVTPAYASPEQLRNEVVTTACDIYSLGVILHELLAGSRPATEASMVAMIERAIAETEPHPLEQGVSEAAAGKRGLTERRLRSALCGDLSIITGKCLAARPSGRYASVDAMANDIQRYLDGRPVLARRPTTVYRVNKFVRRNAGKVAFSLVMVTALIGTAGYAWWRQQQALHDARRALVMQTFMTRLFRAANSNVMGKPVSTIKELLQLGLRILPDMVPDPGDQRRAQLSLGESLYLNDDFPTAKKAYTDALNSALSAGDMGAEAEAFSQLGLIAYFEGRNDVALSDTERGYDLSRRRNLPPELHLLGTQAYVLIHEDLGKTPDKNVEYLTAAIHAARADHLPAHTISAALIQLGGVLSNRRQFDEAVSAFQEGIALVKSDRLAMCDEAGALYGLGGVFRNQAQPEKAIPVLRDSYERMKKCYGDSSFTLQTLGYWADAMISDGHAQEALPELEAIAPEWRLPAVNKLGAAQYFVTIGRAYMTMGRFQDAEASVAEGFHLIDGQLAATDHRIGQAQLLWARALMGQGRYADAAGHADIAARILSANALSPLAKKHAEEARQIADQIAQPRSGK